MPRKNHLMLVILLALLLTLVIIVFAPFAVSNGVRFWIWWRARQEGFVVSVEGIDAPFLSPLVIHEIHLKSTRDNALRIEVTATDAKVALNLKHLLLHMRGRLIRNLSIEQFRVELRRSTPNVQALTRQGWATLQRLLPESLNIAKAEVRVENGPNLILLRGGSLSASASEPGRFSAAEIMIASPWLHQTFSQLRGATHWEANRLTLGGLTLSRGLDLQSAAADLSRLGKQRVGLQFDLDAFGGKIRGNVSLEWRSQHSNWKIAGRNRTREGNLSSRRIRRPRGRFDSRRQRHLSWKSRRAGPRNCVALERTDRAYLAHSHGRSNHARRCGIQS